MGDRFRVELSKNALKDLKSHRNATKAVSDAIAKLESAPESGHALTGDLAGFRALEISVKGSGAFRALYLLRESERVCIVFAIGPHEGVYDRARRRLRG